MKKISIFLCFIGCSLFIQTAYSQTEGCQLLKLKNGSTFDVQVDSISEKTVYYKLCPVENNSPTQKAVKNNVLNIQELVPLHASKKTIIDFLVITKDGNEFTGELLEETDEFIRLKTKTLGELKILKTNIKESENVGNQKVELSTGKVWRENHQATRYFWSPNGYGLKKGEGYYQNNWIMLNQVSYGFTDNFSMGVGTIPIFLFGAPVVPFWITPKISIPIKEEQFNVGGGLLLGGVIGTGDDTGYAGIAYGVTTFGDRDANINIGLGYGFIEDDWSDVPIFTISGMYRYSKSGFLLTENWVIEQGAVASFGGRTIWKKLSLDYGFLVPIPFERFVIPWLGFSIAFK